MGFWSFVLGEKKHGTGRANPPALGRADQSPGIGAGTLNAVPGAITPLTAAQLAMQQAFIAHQAAIPYWAASLTQLGALGANYGPSPLGLGAAAPNMAPAMPWAAPLPRAGVTVGELVGWRIWQVRRRDRLLQSFSADRIWLPGEPMTGKPTDHGPEGVWAFNDPLPAARKLRESVRYLPAFPHSHRLIAEGCAALGSVYLWGEVVEHEIGWRAEFAEVRSLEWVGPEMTALPLDKEGSPVVASVRFVDGVGGRVALHGCDEALLEGLHQRYGVGLASEARS